MKLDRYKEKFRLCLCTMSLGGASNYICSDFDSNDDLIEDISINDKGNIVVNINTDSNMTKSSNFFFNKNNLKRIVFTSDGVCISHLPSPRYTHHKLNAFLVKSFSELNRDHECAKSQR